MERKKKKDGEGGGGRTRRKRKEGEEKGRWETGGRWEGYIRGMSINGERGISLTAQWLGIGLPMHWTWVGPLVWKDHSCHQAIKPVCHNYRADTPGPELACTAQQKALQ